MGSKEAVKKKQSEFEVTDIPHLRDFIAVSALSLLSNPDFSMFSPKEIADLSYTIADAMLKRREEPYVTTK